MKKYLTIDIGGTFIKYGVYTRNAEEIKSGQSPTKKDPKDFLEDLLRIIKDTKEDISGIAISMAGFLNPITGENTDYSIGDNFKYYNIKKELHERTGFNVSVENDGKCAALAESWLGNGKDADNICVVTLGTSVGGGIIIDRKLVRGKNFKAGEFDFSHIGRTYSGEGEKFITPPGTLALVRRVSEALKEKVDGKYIFNNLNNPIIKTIYDDWITEVAMLIGNVAVCLDPEKVLIGGGISAQSSFIEDLKNKIYSIHPKLNQYTLIEPCYFRNDAGKIGALYNYLLQYEI